MEKKNVVAIIVVFVLLTIIKIIGVENIPFNMIIIILTICVIGMILSAFKFKGIKKEKQLLLFMTLLIVLLIGTLMAAVYIENNYPQISNQYRPVFITIMAILFLCLLIAVLANVMYKHNNRFKK
ncbi:hypothetical protein [Clostridium sp. JNZ J1-5]